MRDRKGFAKFIFFVLLIAAIIGIVYGYTAYTQLHTIALFDGEMTRFIDIPPYSKRISPTTMDLKGICTVDVGTTAEQADTFFGGMSSRRGFIFRSKENGRKIEFELRPDYIVKGEYKDTKLIFNWVPVLSESLLKKYQEAFPGEKPTAATNTKNLPRK